VARRSRPHSDPEAIAEALKGLITRFQQELKKDDLRAKVRALIPSFHALRDLGSSLIPASGGQAARERILAYILKYPHVPLDGDELMVVSGIGEWARRLRELRVQFGWWIYSGKTLREMADEAEGSADTLGFDPKKLKPDQYVLMNETQDKEAAYRWNILNSIRKERLSVQAKILKYLRQNVGQPVTGEELRYLAKEKKEWARRTRELRTEDGWPIATRMSGREDLPVGVYVLEEDRQAEPHDRHIPDDVRVDVLKRDSFRCAMCSWDRSQLSKEDPRKFLELHHKTAHKDRGANTVANLLTLCNVCHDKVHRGRIRL
jgi:hypothetical protein